MGVFPAIVGMPLTCCCWKDGCTLLFVNWRVLFMVPDMVQPQARMRPNQFRNQATVVQREGGGGYSSTPCNGLLAEATCITPSKV